MEQNVLGSEVAGIEAAGRKWGCLTWFDPARQGHSVTGGLIVIVGIGAKEAK